MIEAMGIKLGHAALGATLTLGCAAPDPIQYGDSAGSTGSETGDDGGVGFCGDGIVQDGESCDDANADDLDACHDDCTVPGSTLWVALVDDTWGIDVAVASDAIYVGGSQTDSPYTDWITTMDPAGVELDTRGDSVLGVMGIAVSEDDRLVFVRSLDLLGEYQVCARNAPSGQDQCVPAEWDGGKVWVGGVDAGFGRTVTTAFVGGTYFIHELDADAGIADQIAFEPPHSDDHILHGLTPTGHVVVQKWEDALELYWLDDDGVLGQQGQVAVPLDSAPYGVAVANDGRLALNIVAPSVAETNVALIGADGVRGPSIGSAGSFRGIAFAANGDLFTVEVTGEEEIENGEDVQIEVDLARWSPEGSERWRRTWAEPGEQAHALRIGPDGTLYIAGRRAPVDGEAVGFIRAVRP
jgi:cysteine-rich repeat protein